MNFRWLLLGVLLTAAIPSFAAEADVADSRDPAGLERFPRSWIIDHVRDEEVRPRQFVVHRLERLRGGHREGAILRFDAALESALYRIPDGVPVADVAVHFRAAVDDGLLYRCSGRECGRSNDWANQVFGKAILYGPDGNQAYLAWETQGRLVAVYVIERGNKRVYAYVQVLDPVDEALVGANVLFARRVTGQGWAVVDGILPAADGRLPVGAVAILASLTGALAEFAGEKLYLVCHLYDATRPSDQLRTASERCAQEAIGLLVKGGLPASVRIQPFGAGPFAPRGAAPVARLEVIAPRLLATADPAAPSSD